ncbi:MAG: YfiR/HmsC family protein, partial [Kangiellaceae bacterium]|nr:YfiR/HmsC family protein [Kangiellaceae bacterium]
MTAIKFTFKRTLSLCFFLIVTGLIFTSPNSSLAQQNISEEQFKTVFIFHLLKEIEWSKENEIEIFKVAVVGNAPELISQFRETIKNKKVKGKSVTVTQVFDISEMSNYHLLYILKDQSIPLERITNATVRTNTLIVTEETNDKKNTMVNLLRTEEGGYTFEINKANIIFEYMKVGQDILFLGGTEMDVAELFKESSIQLAQLKQELTDQNTALEQSKKQLKESNRQYQAALKESQRIKQQMQVQAQLLEQKTKELEEKNISIREKEGVLLAIKNELDETSSLLKTNEALLGQRLGVIATKEKEVSSLIDQIKENQAILQKQQSEMQKQEVLLTEQERNIVEQGSQIEKQQLWLVASAVVVAIFGLLLMMIVYFNKERKRANLQLIEKNSALSEVQKELLVARDQAQAANEAKSSFLANMSHEIRTPMNAIIGMLHLTQQTELNDKQVNYVSKIDNAANSLLEIINDILDFSKVEAGELKMEKIEFDLSKVMNDLSNLTGLKIQQKGLEFIFEISPEIPEVLIGDPLRISQILINLTNNAMKFTESGEVKVKVSLGEKSSDHLKLKFNISDTGIGMTKEVASRLFKPFSQADTSTTRKFGGTGLGLAICKRLIEQMNGKIRVESSPNEGSNFSFDIKLKYRSSKSILNRIDNITSLNNKHILIVIANHSCQQAVRAILRSFKCHTTIANSFESCLGIIRTAGKQEQQFDNVLIDYQIALANLDELSSIRKNTNAKLTMLLPASTENEEQISNKVSPDLTLVKPITPSSLLDNLMLAFAGDSSHEISQRLALSAEKEQIKALNIALRSRKVLVVEDNEINQEVAREILSQADMSIDLACNGQEAVQKATSNRYDFILMDIQMPIMDGYQAARAIRESYSFDELPIIAMTANAMGGDKEKCLASGMNDYISKPIRINEFFETISKWIKTKEELMPPSLTSPVPMDIKQSQHISGVDFAGGVEL